MFKKKIYQVRNSLQKWRPGFIVYGCAAHYMNLAEHDVTNREIEKQKSMIVEV